MVRFKPQRPSTWCGNRQLSTAGGHGIDRGDPAVVAARAVRTAKGPAGWDLAGGPVPDIRAGAEGSGRWGGRAVSIWANRNLKPRHAANQPATPRIPKLRAPGRQASREGRMSAFRPFYGERSPGRIREVRGQRGRRPGQGCNPQRGQASVNPQAPVSRAAGAAALAARSSPAAPQKPVVACFRCGSCRLAAELLCSEIEPKGARARKRSRLAGGDAGGSGQESRGAMGGSTSCVAHVLEITLPAGFRPVTDLGRRPGGRRSDAGAQPAPKQAGSRPPANLA